MQAYTRPGQPEKVFNQRKLLSFTLTVSNPAASEFTGFAEFGMCASDGEVWPLSRTGMQLTSDEVKSLMATNETVRQAFLTLPPALFAVFDLKNSQ